MNDPSPNPGMPAVEPLGAPSSSGTTGPKMLVPLFLVPLLIVAVIVAIFLGVGAFVGNEKSAEQWIAEVETGGVNERWQAAASLTDMALRDPARLSTPELRKRLRSLFEVVGPQDTRIRKWVAQMWGLLGDSESAPLVVDGIARMKEKLALPQEREGPEGEPALKELIDYIRALGKIGNRSDTPAALSVAADSDRGVRMAVAEALGNLGRKAIVAGESVGAELGAALVRLHEDADLWVRMNAALALAKCGRVEGLPTLEVMLDRAWLKEQNLGFPDDGKYSVTTFDPAAEPIASALLAIEALLPSLAVESGENRSLRAAVEKAASDQNPALQQRARALLARLGS